MGSIVCGETTDVGRRLEAFEGMHPPTWGDAEKRPVGGGSRMPDLQHMVILHTPPTHVSMRQLVIAAGTAGSHADAGSSGMTTCGTAVPAAMVNTVAAAATTVDYAVHGIVH